MMSMKTMIVTLSGLTMIMMACNHSATESRYLDLNSGNYVELQKDSSSGEMVEVTTHKPVSLYVDTKTHDTIYGHTGEVVNGKVYKTDSGNWEVKGEGDEYKAKSDDGTKIKSEGEETKLKDGEYTVKTDGDGDVKIENGKTQTKIDGKTGEVKTKKDHNITNKVKKIFH
jgi:hypothetical protein